MSDSIPTSGPLIETAAQWTWDTTGAQPVVTSYPGGKPTKSGLMPADLAAFIQLPLQSFANPPVPVSDATAIQWIRWAEDEIETETNIRLCQTWIAAPPTRSRQETGLLNIGAKYNYQQLGVDFDYREAAYDFFFERAKEEGWLYQRLRWRPVKGVDLCDPTGIVNPNNYVGLKNVAFIYPLLNEFFRIPQSWVVEDQNRGLIRMVPAVSVQLLPLVAMQLAFMGFATSVPGGLWYQYTAGLTSNDYNSTWSFMQQLVLAKAGVIALTLLQTSLNMGDLETLTQADGLALKTRYGEKGPFFATINNMSIMSDRLLKRAKQMGGGVFIGVL
jgi:hypothetical protein